MQSNIETIIKQIKKESKLVIQFRKYNGISLECRTAIDGDRDKAIAEMRTILDKCNFVPYDIERHKEVPNAFLVQFPNLDVTYTEDEKIKMYKDIFKFLLDTVNRNQETMIPKSQIIDYKDKDLDGQPISVVPELICEEVLLYITFYNNFLLRQHTLSFRLLIFLILHT